MKLKSHNEQDHTFSIVAGIAAITVFALAATDSRVAAAENAAQGIDNRYVPNAKKCLVQEHLDSGETVITYDFNKSEIRVSDEPRPTPFSALDAKGRTQINTLARTLPSACIFKPNS